MNDPIPSELTSATEALWRSGERMMDNIYAAPAFVNLRETCRRLYPSAGSTDAVNIALSHAVHALGFRRSDNAPAQLAVSAEVAAIRIHRAFRQKQASLMHLCPLDLADDIPNTRFGPNTVRTYTAEELDDLLDPDELSRKNAEWRFDSQRFCRFSWLVVEETKTLSSNSGSRAFPELCLDFHEDFGSIDPHEKRFPVAVEDALFALLTVPWENVTQYCQLDWRPFRIPWVYTLSDDLFTRRSVPADADTLSWEPDFYENDDGDTVEVERPRRWPLTDAPISQTAYLDDKAWSELSKARLSALFAGPVEHFLIRAFASDGIDEFLAHITVIEAALGMPDDHDPRRRFKIPEQPRQGATARVAWRLAALLNDPLAGERYSTLFKERSYFLHGQAMTIISSQMRLDARRLAHRCVCALMGAATSASPPENKDAFLNELLQRGSTRPARLEP